MQQKCLCFIVRDVLHLSHPQSSLFRSSSENFRSEVMSWTLSACSRRRQLPSKHSVLHDDEFVAFSTMNNFFLSTSRGYANRFYTFNIAITAWSYPLGLGRGTGCWWRKAAWLGTFQETAPGTRYSLHAGQHGEEGAECHPLSTWGLI